MKLSEAYRMAVLARVSSPYFKTTVQTMKELMQVGTDAAIIRALPMLGMPSINYEMFLPGQLRHDIGKAGIAAMWECIDWLWVKAGWTQTRIADWIERVEQYTAQAFPGMLERMRSEVPDGFADRPKFMERTQ